MRQIIKEVLKGLVKTTDIVINDYEDIYKYTAEQLALYFEYVIDGGEGYVDSEVVERLEERLNTPFPGGLRDMPEEVILYRALFLTSKKDMLPHIFGQHYVSDIMNIDDDFLMKIGSEAYDDEYFTYVYKVKIPRSEIDFKKTIMNNLAFPSEEEITTKTNKPKMKILKVWDYRLL